MNTKENTPARLPAEASLPDTSLLAHAQLSPRQQQILALLQAGKVNKEIANELGIGLGTVKQHVVALFKKLNVRNRTMAASRFSPQHGSTVAGFTEDTLLERRPCAVLSFSLTENAPSTVGRVVHQVLAAWAYDRDAIYLARREAGGDLIFGIQQASEEIVFRALHAAQDVLAALTAADIDAEHDLSAGLTVGLAVASMWRTGGWSGEAIASVAIARARELARNAPPGQLDMDASVSDLFRALGPTGQALAPETLPLTGIEVMPTRFSPFDWEESSPIGRSKVLVALMQLFKTAAAGEARYALLEGETGMGKSRLCREAARHAVRAGGQADYLACRRIGSDCLVHDLVEGRILKPEQLAARLSAPMERPMLSIIDDCHCLPADFLPALLHQGLPPARLLLLSGRRQTELAAQVDASWHLGRLPAADTARIVQRHGPALSEASTGEIVELAAGVPLFAVELARANGDLPLSLRVVVGARLDRLRLDPSLLRQVARAPGAWEPAQLAAALGASEESVERAAHLAVSAGALKLDSHARYVFTHPLLRQAVLQAEVDRL